MEITLGLLNMSINEICVFWVNEIREINEIIHWKRLAIEKIHIR